MVASGALVRLSRRSSLGVSRRWLDITSLVCLVGIVAGAVMAIGSVHPAVLAAVFLLATASATLIVLHEGFGRELAPAAILLVLAAASALQAASLPASFIAAIAPKNAATFAEALRPWRLDGPSHHSLSLDAAATWVEVARHVTYAATLIVAAKVARAWGSLAIAAVVFGVALVVALTTLAHGIVEARSVFGIYEPRYATPRLLSPLLNPNNLAGYLNLGAFCGAALLTSHRFAVVRLPVVLGIAILVGVSVICGSRGALLTLVLGCAALAVRYRKALRHWQPLSWLQLAAVVVTAATLAQLAARDDQLAAYSVTHTKLALFGWVTRLIRDYTWLGVGRGAFESAFPPYREASIAGTTSNVTFAHAENFLLHWAAEWGGPLSLAAITAGLYVAWRWGRRTSGAAMIAIGLAALLLQNLADVALEVPAVCIAIVTASAVFFASKGRPRFAPPSWPPGVVVAAAAASTALLALCAWRVAGLDTVTNARDRLLKIYADTRFENPASRAEFDRALRREVLRRPGEPYFHLLGARAARQSRGEPNRWLSRALELDPTRAETYYVLGRILAERGFLAQGLDAMRHALTQEPRLSRKVARAAVKLTTTPELLLRAAPERGCDYLTEVASRLKTASLPFLVEAAARFPSCSGVVDKYAEQALAKAESARSDELPAAAVAAEHAVATAEKARLEPNKLNVLRARLIALQAGPKEALAALVGRCPAPTEDLACTKQLLRFAAAGGNHSDFSRVSRDFLAAACDESAACVKAEQLVGDLAAQRQDWPTALAHHERAARLGGGKSAWKRYSDVARKAGASGRSADALRRAQQHADDDPEPPPSQAPDDDD